jgi:hypothetical protein
MEPTPCRQLRNEPSGDRPGGFFLAAAFCSEREDNQHGSHRKNQQRVIGTAPALEQSLGCKQAQQHRSRCDHVEHATAAVDNTIGKRAAEAAGLARPGLDFVCFVAAMMNPLGGSGRICSPTLTLPCRKLIFDLASPSHDLRLKTLSAVVNRR